jgi:hypothetical protein
MRRDARHRFARIVSHGVPRILLASFSFRSRHRFSNVVFNLIPRFPRFIFWQRQTIGVSFPTSWPMAFRGSFVSNMACCDGNARRQFLTIVTYGDPRFVLASFVFRIRRRGHRRRDSWRLSSYFVLNVIPRTMYAKSGVYLPRSDDWRRFASIVPYGIPRLIFV